MGADHHLITREIGIDMGHRVTYHGSKCRNLHGHRYSVHVTCKGPLYTSGEQQGMVLDFGFLKTLMMEEIDAPCDHGLCLWAQDPLLGTMVPDDHERERLYDIVEEKGYVVVPEGISVVGKLYLVNFVPTAENLAHHWAQRLAPRITQITLAQAQLYYVTVYETPNCSSVYMMPE